MPSVNVVHPATGAVVAAAEIGELDYYLRRGWNPQTGTPSSARAAFGANYDTPAALESSATFGLRGEPAAVQALTARNGIVVPSAAAVLQPWWAALANRHYTPANIVCVGDSVTEGEGATAQNRRWINRLTDQLRAALPTLGLTGGGRGLLGAYNTGETTYPWPATLGGGAAYPGGTSHQYGPKRGVVAVTTGQTITYTLTGTGADIEYVKGTFTGSFSWAVDGGSATTINTSAGSTSDGNLTRIALGSSGAHTLVLTGVTGTSYIGGVIEYDGDESKGIRVHDCGHFGYSTTQWIAAGTSATQNWPAAIKALSPSLILLNIGTNDVLGGSVSTYKAQLATLIGLLRASLTAPHPPIVLVVQPARQNQTAAWDAYKQAQYEIAAADTGGIGGASGITVCDLSTRLPNVSDAQTFGLYDGNAHPLDKGHALMADLLTRFLTPG